MCACVGACVCACLSVFLRVCLCACIWVCGFVCVSIILHEMSLAHITLLVDLFKFFLIYLFCLCGQTQIAPECARTRQEECARNVFFKKLLLIFLCGQLQAQIALLAPACARTRQEEYPRTQQEECARTHHELQEERKCRPRRIC